MSTTKIPIKYIGSVPIYLTNVPSHDKQNYCTRNKKIYGLVHELSEQNSIKVLKSRLMSPVTLEKKGIKATGGQSSSDSWKNGGQYPGVYTFGILANQVGTPLLGKGSHFSDFDDSPIALVFSSALLERKAWHMNVTDLNGYITDKTYFPEDISNFPFDDYKSSPHGNEIVFHDDIDLEFLEEIWVKKYIKNPKLNDQYAEKFKELLKKNGLEKFVALVKTDAANTGIYPNRKFEKFCDDRQVIQKLRNGPNPNYCSVYYDINERRIIPNMKTLKMIAMNCGLDKDDADSMYFDELHQYVMNHQNERAENR
jgi:hypothetical protein